MGEQLVDSRSLELVHEVGGGLLQGEHLHALRAHELHDARGIGAALVHVAGHDAQLEGGWLVRGTFDGVRGT